MPEKQIQLHDLLDTHDPKQVISEVMRNIKYISTDYPSDGLNRLFNKVLAVFSGKYPGYRAGNTGYHDLEHTLSVALAAARMLHGGFIRGHLFNDRHLTLAIAAALFHDIGFIQYEEDQEGTGAKYTIGHEERSIQFVRQLFPDAGYSPVFIKDCADLIRCTILTLPLSSISFRTEKIKILGQIVGSADLIAQLADRIYLKKLLLLYKEFKEAGIQGYESEYDLLDKTDEFYNMIVKNRMKEEFSDVSGFLPAHFKFRHGIGRDLYEEMIHRNMDFLNEIINVKKIKSEKLIKYIEKLDSNFPEQKDIIVNQ